MEFRAENQIGDFILESPAYRFSIYSHSLDGITEEVTAGGEKRGSFTRGNWEDEKDPAQVIRRSGQRMGEENQMGSGFWKPDEEIVQELFPLTMSNAPKKSSKMKTKN